MKCEICSKKVEETFLSKPIGTLIKDAKGKKRMVCFECQKSQMQGDIKDPVRRLSDIRLRSIVANASAS